jgi:hypothetical protein
VIDSLLKISFNLILNLLLFLFKNFDKIEIKILFKIEKNKEFEITKITLKIFFVFVIIKYLLFEFNIYKLNNL